MGRRLALMRSLLRGDPGDASGRTIVLAITLAGGAASFAANVAGAIVVFVLLAVVLPTPDELDRGSVLLRNLVAASVYLAASLAIGAVVIVRRSVGVLRWLRDEREPVDEERDATLGLALLVTLRQSRYWALAVVGFGVVNGTASVVLGVEVAVTVAIGGVVTAAATYLMYQRITRPAVARALASEPPGKFRVPGVALRTFVVWGLGTGLPVAGVAMVAGTALVLDVPRRDLAVSALVLSCIALGAGMATMLLFARSLVDPLRGMREAVRSIEAGDLDVAVPVYDASELGFLQAGLNRMAAGLRERERMRDLFGRHVGDDVARRAMEEEGVSLGGEVRDVGVLFVDVVGSTAFTAEHDAATVVGALNDFFGIVVEVTRRHGGQVNKFEGDAALCVWGAPLAVADPAGAALAAGRELATALAEAGGLPAAVGVSAGPCVAGNVGAEDRLEYTVIGDAVNEAARLTERAKDRDGRLLASRAAVDAAGGEEAARWTADGEEVLRGHVHPTGLAVPVEAA